jgi:hypothetical protein
MMCVYVKGNQSFFERLIDPLKYISSRTLRKPSRSYSSLNLRFILFCTVGKEALEDNNFHKLIAEATHNFSVSVVMNPIYSLMPRFVDFVYGKTEDRKDNTLNFHKKIYKAIEGGKDSEVSQIMKEHLASTEKSFLNTHNK